jgi:hypothetical protein
VVKRRSGGAGAAYRIAKIWEHYREKARQGGLL